MGTKQKYKVFINDQPVYFVSSAEDCSNGCIPVKDAAAITAIRKGDCFCLIDDEPRIAWKNFTASYKIIQAAGGIVWYGSPGNKLLMIFRLGKWDLPKGKIDRGESPDVAALREVSEECGINGMKIMYRLSETWHMFHHKGEWKLKQTFWYEMTYEGDEKLTPQLDESIEIAKWVTPKELAFLLPAAYASIRELIESVVDLK